jgi:WD40 repeat protein
VTATATDALYKFLAVGSSSGNAKVLNFKSGGVLYDLPRQEKEITCIRFLNEKSEFWILAGCWSGKIILYTKPSAENFFRITAKSRIGHRGDIMALECSKLIFTSGGTDGYLSVWNSFTGMLKHAIELPNPKDSASSAPSNNRRLLHR